MNTQIDGNIQHLDLDQLAAVMPSWLRGISVGRAQLIVDQIRSIVQQAREDGYFSPGKTSKTAGRPSWVWMAGGSCAAMDARLSVLAVQTAMPLPIATPLIGDNPPETSDPGGKVPRTDSPRDGENISGDWATVLHGGFLPANVGNNVSKQLTEDELDKGRKGTPTSAPAGNDPEVSDPAINDLAKELTEAFLAEMRNRSIRFVQWATDPVDNLQSPMDPQNHPCSLMGFKPLATLQYMSLSMVNAPASGSNRGGSPSRRLKLVPIDWESRNERDNLTDLVESTYFETRDCPAVNQFRSAEQTLRSYQLSKVFAPDRWYWVVNASKDSSFEALGASEASVGVVIFATHSDQVSELVYMALAPSQRGVGLGRELFELALSEVRQHAPTTDHRLVLAVDENNSAATKIYQEKGFQSILRETVWGRGVDEPTTN